MKAETAQIMKITESEMIPLHAEDRNRLAEAESAIETARVAINDQFLIIGRTLCEIRDRLLYRETHRCFEEYVEERWKISRGRAYQLIAAKTVVENVHNFVEIPNEGVARQLAPLPKVQQIAVAKVLAKSTKRLTAKVAEEAVHRVARGGLAAAAIAERSNHAQPEIDLNLKPKMTPIARAQAAATVSEWWEANKTRCPGYPAVPTAQVVQQIIALFS